MLMPPAGGGLELLAHPHHRLDRRIAERVHVGGLEHHLGLGEGGGRSGPLRRG